MKWELWSEQINIISKRKVTLKYNQQISLSQGFNGFGSVWFTTNHMNSILKIDVDLPFSKFDVSNNKIGTFVQYSPHKLVLIDNV